MSKAVKTLTNPITDSGVIHEVVDSENGIISSDRSANYPSVAERRDSMRRGLEGKGTSEKTYSEMLQDLNQEPEIG